MSQITMPTIHLNGTPVGDLLIDNCDAGFAIKSAIVRIHKMEFHMRDYYPVEGAWDKAVAERAEVLKKLHECSEYFIAIAEHCADAQAERESRRSK
jgi:hypothetical protein